MPELCRRWGVPIATTLTSSLLTAGGTSLQPQPSVYSLLTMARLVRSYAKHLVTQTSQWLKIKSKKVMWLRPVYICFYFLFSRQSNSGQMRLREGAILFKWESFQIQSNFVLDFVTYPISKYHLSVNVSTIKTADMWVCGRAHTLSLW